MTAARSISFRELVPDDLAQLFTWLSRPHVSRWYAAAPSSFAEVAAKYGPRTEPGNIVQSFIFRVDDRDAGYIQTYAIRDFPEYAALVAAEDDAAGVDLFIGEEPLLGWGLGPRVVRRFVSDLVFARNGASVCLAGPAEGNHACVRAFEKAGFVRWKKVRPSEGAAEWVLRGERERVRHAFEPIDTGRDFDTCVAFRRDSYVASFGSLEGFADEMGADHRLYREQLRARIAQVPEGNCHLWRDGQIVGQAEMRLFEEDSRVGYVSFFYVAPECRGAGLGRLLHEHAAAVFRRRGMRALRLSVSIRNENAIAFYQRLGWVAVGARPNKEPMEILEYDLS
jgi:ribosomal protein S18 acetylase RimI-like enzyme